MTERKIAALFVDDNGVYSNLTNVDVWGKERDARTYCGPYAVIAHPPCQRWGNMALANYARWGGEHNKIGNDDGCFESALKSVQRYGGVLEHPKNSRAWDKFGLVKPKVKGWVQSSIGFTCEVWQSAYGHKANKATWLYYVGHRRPPEMVWDKPIGSHQIGFPDKRGKERNKPTLSKKEANGTPILYRDTLIEIPKYSRSVR